MAANDSPDSRGSRASAHVGKSGMTA